MSQQKRQAKRKATGISVKGIIILIVLLAISGFALKNAHAFDEPITTIQNMLAFNNLGDPGDFPPMDFADTTADSAPVGDTTALDLSTADTSTSDTVAVRDFSAEFDAIAGGEGRIQESGIRWDEFSNVLFNLWYILAATVFIMIVQKVLRFVSGKDRRTAKRSAPLNAIDTQTARKQQFTSGPVA